MFLFSSLFEELFNARDKFLEDSKLEKREMTHKVGSMEHKHTLYYYKDGTLAGMRSEANYVPDELEEKLNMKKLELSKMLKLDTAEGYLRAAEIKKELLELEGSLQKV